MLVGKEISMRARVGAPLKVGGGQAQIVKFSETGYPKSVVEVCRHADGGGQQLPAPRAPVMCAQPRLRVPARVGTLILRAGAARAVCVVPVTRRRLWLVRWRVHHGAI